MIPRYRSTLALIIDHDLGFLMWLGEVFTALECQTIPALDCRQALTLSKRLQMPITTLVVNPELRGARRMVKLLVAANPGLRVVLIRDSATGGSGSADLLGVPTLSVLERPGPGDPISYPEWVRKVRKTLG